MPKILMTFDLKDAEDDDYRSGYEALVKVGLSRVSQNKKLRLPFSSVMGDTSGKDAAEIRDRLKTILEGATTKKVDRLFVAVLQDWACHGDADKDLWLEELVQRFQAQIDLE